MKELNRAPRCSNVRCNRKNVRPRKQAPVSRRPVCGRGRGTTVPRTCALRVVASPGIQKMAGSDATSHQLFFDFYTFQKHFWNAAFGLVTVRVVVRVRPLSLCTTFNIQRQLLSKPIKTMVFKKERVGTTVKRVSSSTARLSLFNVCHCQEERVQKRGCLIMRLLRCVYNRLRCDLLAGLRPKKSHGLKQSSSLREVAGYIYIHCAMYSVF